MTRSAKVQASSFRMDDVGQRFGSVVRQLREARGWSQERLAGRAELNRSYMGEIERATAMPSLATALKLAQALDVPPSELIVRCEDCAKA